MRLIDADEFWKQFDDVIPVLHEWAEYVSCDGDAKRVIDGTLAIYDEIKQRLDATPTVEAEPKWIPVTERLPEDNRGKQIIITLDPSYGDGKRMVSRCAYFTHGRFYSCESHGVYMNSAVKAWMPLPEPYEVKHE